LCHSYDGRRVVPPSEIPDFIQPEIRHLIDFALEDAWQELRKDRLSDDASSVKGKLATTIIALAASGEFNPIRLKNFALQSIRATDRPRPAPRQVAKWRLNTTNLICSEIGGTYDV
jgi:hypothetical protein